MNANTPTRRPVVVKNDGRLVQAHWRAGRNDGGLHRLLPLRVVYRQYRAELDGLEANPRAQFARWLDRRHKGSE